MTAYGYVRVSHEGSTLSGLSPEAQRKAIYRYATAMRLPLAETFYPPQDHEHPGMFTDYSTSAWKCRWSKRPAASMIERQLQPGDHIIIWSIHRGFRNTEDFITTLNRWKEKGIAVHFLQEQFNLASANGKLLGTIIAALAEWQSHIKSERIRDSLAARKARKSPAEKKERIIQWKPSEVVMQQIDQVRTEQVQGKIYSYARKSRVERADDDSLSAQETITRSAAEYIREMKPWLSIADHYVDEAVSAFSIDFRDRPNGSKLDQVLQRGDMVVVSRLDRAWRRLGDMLNTINSWIERGVVVHFCDMGMDTTSVMGKFFIHIMATFAELESSMRSASTRAAMAEARAQGRCVGEIPIGTRPCIDKTAEGTFKRLVWNRHELREIRIIHYLSRKRKWSGHKISAFLENVFAKREGRKPIPHWGREVRKGAGATYRRVTIYPRWLPQSINYLLPQYERRWKERAEKFAHSRRRNRARRLRMISEKAAKLDAQMQPHAGHGTIRRTTPSPLPPISRRSTR